MMSNHEIGECGDRLQWLFEVLHAIRKIKGDRFPDIEAELSTMLRMVTVSYESIPFQEVMRLCDKCAEAIDFSLRECSGYLNRGSGASGFSLLATGVGPAHVELVLLPWPVQRPDSSELIRLRSSRPKSSDKDAVWLASITLASGCRPRNQGGKRYAGKVWISWSAAAD
jgi:hypothetical protein